MDWSSKYFADWNAAKKSRAATPATSTITSQTSPHKWKPPVMGSYKLNTDAAIKLGDSTFSIGLILRNHEGGFVMG